MKKGESERERERDFSCYGGSEGLERGRRGLREILERDVGRERDFSS